MAVAQYDFFSQTVGELSFKTGQQLRLAPKELQPKVRGWLLASTDGTQTGLVPANYIKILGPSRGHGAPATVPQPSPVSSDQSPEEL